MHELFGWPIFSMQDGYSVARCLARTDQLVIYSRMPLIREILALYALVTRDSLEGFMTALVLQSV
jgi:hypothetical protein